MKIYLNGKIQDANSLEDILEPGFLFGWGVFETLRVYGGRVAFLKEHIKRLKNGCKKIALTFPDIDFEKQINLLLKRNRLKDAYCRITVFKKRTSTGVIIYIAPFSYYKKEDYKKGFKALVSSFTRNSKHPLVGVKAISYLENRLAWKIAQDKGKDEAIFLNENGFLTEGSRTNLFFVKNKTVYTPSLDCGLLNGITRQKVIRVIKGQRFKLKEAKLKVSDLLSADEAFLTSSLMEVMSLVELDGRRIGSGRPGLITSQIHTSFKAKSNI